MRYLGTEKPLAIDVDERLWRPVGGYEKAVRIPFNYGIQAQLFCGLIDLSGLTRIILWSRAILLNMDELAGNAVGTEMHSSTNQLVKLFHAHRGCRGE